MRKPFYLCWFFLFLFAATVSGQCFDITTAPQLKVCSSEQGTLSATPTGTVLFSEWTPNKGLNNPLSLNSPITDPFDTTYTIKARGFLENQNLLANGDFSEGDTGFTSQYEAESTKPGGYIIGTVGTDLFPDAKACEDHTTPEAGGNMLMVRVSETNNLDIYCQEISISPNQDYHFKGFATGLVLNSPPVIVLKINEEIVSVGTLGSFACSWQQIRGDWNAGNATSAKICLSVSQEDIGAGTDFVLDDIGFYEVCEVEKTVEVEVLDFTLNIAEEIGLPCGDNVRLNAKVIPGDIYFLTEWSTTNGNIVSGDKSLSPLVDTEGIYEIAIITTIDEQTCRAEKTVEVVNVSQDSLAIFMPETLHCMQREITLEAMDEVDRKAFLYEWTSKNGQITSNPTIPIIQIDQPGVYQLQRTDLAGNCPQRVDIDVKETSLKDFSFELTPPDCDQSTGTILFDKLVDGEAPFLYSIDNGNTFLPDRVFPNLEGGDYELMVQDANECGVSKPLSFTAFTGVKIDLPTDVRIETTDQFQFPLGINIAEDLIENIVWTPAIGLSCVDCLQPLLTNKKSQTYHVTINDKNNCEAQAMIQIEVVEPSDVYIPSAFSPNQDGQNDLFFIYANQERVKKINRLNIFDRYGNLVFSRADFLPNNQTSGWDGIYKGEAMPVGVYVYWTELELVDDKLAVFSGEIGLVR